MYFIGYYYIIYARLMSGCSETEPRANLKYAVPEKLHKQPTTKVKKVEEPKDGKFWARGTGYGHGQTGKVDWDVQAYLAAQKQKDKETQSIIEGNINVILMIILVVSLMT